MIRDSENAMPDVESRTAAARPVGWPRRRVLTGLTACIGVASLARGAGGRELISLGARRLGQADLSGEGDTVPEGLAALLARVPGWFLQVFPSSPPISLPQAFPVPYPEPIDGLQAIRNHLVRYTGGGIERWGLAFPVRASGQTYPVGFRSRRIYASHLDGAPSGLLFVAMLGFTSPASLSGQLVLVHEPADFEHGRRGAWVYSPAQRRVRRAPDLAYDAVSDGSEGMLTADQVDGYNGSPDRYDWQLVGLRPQIVPFGTAGMAQAALANRAWLGRGSLDPAGLRFELRPVWIVEARLRPGRAHIYARRRFYIDPDCWTVLLEEVWSGRGALWRVALHAVTSLPDGPGPMTRLSLYHDLEGGSYFVTGFDDPSRPSIRSGLRASMDEFTPDALRRIAASLT
jgi:hypothetical protein